MDADKVIVELLAKTENFDAKVKQSATTAETSLGKIGKAATNAEQAVTRSTGQSSAAISKYSQALKRDMTSVGSILSAPTSPFVMPVKQGPQVASAMRLVSAAGGVMGGILDGVVATGAIAAAAALYELFLKADDTKSKINELVEKLKENAEQTGLTRSAKIAFGQTLEGVTEAIYADEAALKKLTDAEKTAARVALEHAQARLITLQGIRDQTAATLDQARAQNALNKETILGSPGRGFEAKAAAFEQSAKDLDALEKRLGRIDKIITRQSGNVAAALANRVVEIVGQQSDPLERIKQKYEGAGGLIDQAKKRAIAEGTVSTELAKQVRLIKAAQAAEEKRERDRAKKSAGSGEFGRRVDFAGARAIAEGAGFQVNSAQRTYAQQAALYNDPRVNRPGNPVAKPGTSAHEGVRGKWALDIQFAPGLTASKIRKTYGDQGVQLTALYKEKGHFHAEGNTGSGAGPSADTLAKRAQAAADASERRQQAYDNELASLQADEINARQALITSAEEIAQLELLSIDISRAKYADNVKSLQDQRKLTDAEAEGLLKLNEERAKLRKELVQRREDERKFRLAEQQQRASEGIASAALQNQADILQGQAALAKTAKERHDIERKLLDLQYQEERIALQAIINHNERLKLQKGIAESERIEAEAAAIIAELRLKSIPQRQANAQANNDRANASPLQDYFATIPNTAGEINEAFESIATGGLATFTDALTNAIVNFTSLGDVGRAVLQSLAAGLVKMAIQQVILHTVGQALGAASVATTTAAAAAAGAAWAGPAAMASLATLGANAGPAAAALASTTALATVLGAPKAQGGRIFGPGTNTSDSVLTPLSNDEFVIRAASAKKLGYQALEHLNQTGEMPGFAMGGSIRRSPTNGTAARPGTSIGMDDDFKRELRSAVSDAAATMPGIDLYAGFDPAEMFKRALGTPSGRRAMMAWVGENSGGVRASLDR